MSRNSRSKYKRSYKKPSNSGGYNNSRKKRSGYHRGGNNQRSSIKHEQYISKAVDSPVEENLYVESVSFDHFKLAPVVKMNIRDKGYEHPTKIQNDTIYEILQGRDILGMASTGSGKTAAFLLPMLTKILQSNHEKCLIVVPTRELANQIRYELTTFSKNTNILMALIVGGASYGPQISLLRKNPEFVIATPGRLIDLHKQHKIDLKSFNNIVLDEVDRMLDMGFIRDIELIIKNLSYKKQSLFFSATMDYKAENIANRLLVNPLKVEIKQQTATVNIEQNIIKFEFNGEKINKLHNMLLTDEFEKVLVFARTRRGADSLSKELQNRGHKSTAIHGEKSLNQRNRAISQFRRDDLKVLVATDVAARGIDIPDISHIINFDEPASYSDYIHRIGRTGRIGKKGVALTFVR
ncbi:DEAD/DEAH box helicase [Patescibacteria group bacterium]